MLCAQDMLTNASIAELLCREAEGVSDHRARVLEDTARAALMWEEEAADVASSGRSLSELAGVGPSISRRIYRWLDKSPEVTPTPLRAEFLTLAEARRLLNGWRGRKRLQGDLQMHTEWSDGSGSILEMAAAGIMRGYRYVAITDHTQGLQVANGLDEERLRKQEREIEKLNRAIQDKGIEFTVLRSAEMNLSPKGEGDMPPEALKRLDLVLGCFHSSLRSTDDQTGRYLAGLRNPHIQILGHPQTRRFNRRAGLRADWARVFAEAARLGKAVEIDGYAERQDLRVSLLKIARQEGVRISLGTDAHHPEQLNFMELGLASARLAGIPPSRIINFMPVDKLRDWVDSVRGASLPS